MAMYAFSRSGIQSRGDVGEATFGESASNGVRTQCSGCVVVDDTGKRESITSYGKRQIQSWQIQSRHPLSTYAPPSTVDKHLDPPIPNP
jgi:hypothetical protein